MCLPVAGKVVRYHRSTDTHGVDNMNINLAAHLSMEYLYISLVCLHVPVAGEVVRYHGSTDVSL